MSALDWILAFVLCGLVASGIKECKKPPAVAGKDDTVSCVNSPCPTGKHCCGLEKCCLDEKLASC